jgi:hypothetical protein
MPSQRFLRQGKTMTYFSKRELRAVAFAWSLPFCILTWSGAAYAADVRPVVKAVHGAYHAARHIGRRSGLV